jgi:multiple sugar transport system ATP-binding protein
VFENIAFPLRLARGQFTEEQIKQKVNTASSMLELHEHLERKPANLSGGQRQRVAMGRAIVREAEAFLFDEPLSNLDAKLRGQMRTEISRMQRRLGITTVYVTHDQTEAMTLGDRVAVLKKGVLQQCASPRELYEQPVNLFVAGFIGSPPMNFMPAQLEGNTLRMPFASVQVTDEVVQRASGQTTLIAGVRPEHFEAVEAMEPGRVEQGIAFEATVDQTEWMGNELFAYVPFEADADVRKTLDDLDRDLDGEGMRTQIVVALDPTSRVREGETARLWMDPRKMHLFDPADGRNITRNEDSAARIARESEEERRRSLERAHRELEGEDALAG